MATHHYSNRLFDPDNDMMTASSPTYSYTDHSTPPLPPYAPQYPSSSPNAPNTHAISSSPNAHHQSPSSSCPQPSMLTLPTLHDPFPPPLPPPPNLQIRLLPHLPTLSALYSALSHKERTEGLPPLLDEHRMVGKGRVEIEDEEREEEGGGGELSAGEARDALDENVRNRMPFVGLASRRLQAVVGERNDLGFELPDVPLTHTPFLHRITANSSSPSTKLSPNLSPRNQTNANGSSFERRKDSGVGLSFRSPLSPISGFGQVDEKTGRGLREWLLSRGKDTGTQRKRECRNISFHDFTPDMRTGDQENVLVAEYNGGGLHERADVYEVDLPTTYNDPITGFPTQGTQTWIWFLISRPIITLDPNETSTDPDLSEHEIWAELGIWDPKPPGVIRPPPDFPMPIPTSYVVFACPASNVTAYPDRKDELAPTDPSPAEVPISRPFQVNSRSRPREPSISEQDISLSPPTKLYKRKDYDFSFQGTPIFEFSSLSNPHFSVPNPNTSSTSTTNKDTLGGPTISPDHSFTILSLPPMGTWYPRDSSGPCASSEYQTRVQNWESSIENLTREERKEDDLAFRDRSLELPHARAGKWWDVFYEEVYKEESRWRKIREAMSRGKCRIVVRWVEVESRVSPNAGGQGAARKKMKMSPAGLSLSLSGDEGEGSGGESDLSDGGGGVGLGLVFNQGNWHNPQGGSGKVNASSGNGTNSGLTRSESKKLKERLSGRRTSGVAGHVQTRVTRSESRRKSGLGVVTTSQEDLNGAMRVGIVAGNVDSHGGK